MAFGMLDEITTIARIAGIEKLAIRGVSLAIVNFGNHGNFGNSRVC
jgi:hypothetical protein